MKRYGTGAALIVLMLLALTGCLDTLSFPDYSNPLDPANPGTSSREPARPTGLTAMVSDRLVELAWSVGDTAQIDHYRVYRWEVETGEDEDFEFLDTVESKEYGDSDVSNNQEYRYRVSSVNRFGLEGEVSRTLSAVPQVFAVTINQGAVKTASRQVSLRMSASTDTDIMQVSNDAGLTGSQWEPYQSSYTWLLTPGDGVKTVYARFRDDADNESGIVADSIELDTKAVIESVTHDAEGEELSLGDIIHFTLTSGELFGEATVDLGSVVPGIELYDDGTGGDAVPEDGTYERDYTIEHGVEMVEASVVGSFTDEVGNEAEPVVATGTVTVLDPPPAVELNAPVALSDRALALSWSRSSVADFSSYKLYRASEPGVATADGRELIETISDQSRTDYNDRGLDPETTYYYALYVVDMNGLRTISNEVSGTTDPNEPPEPVELYQPWAASDSLALHISWSVNEDSDFKYYELIGWEQDPPAAPEVGEKRVLARLTSPTETFYTHSSLNASLVYWYEVAVVDSLGARALSNTVSASPQ